METIKIGTPIKIDIQAIILLVFSAVLNSVRSRVYIPIPITPPRQFRIISSISPTPILKVYWIISTPRLIRNAQAKAFNMELFLLNTIR